MKQEETTSPIDEIQQQKRPKRKRQPFDDDAEDEGDKNDNEKPSSLKKQIETSTRCDNNNSNLKTKKPLTESRHGLIGNTVSCTSTTKNRHEYMLYGKLCNPRKKDQIGACFACRGAKNSEYDEDDPILLCDGLG